MILSSDCFYFGFFQKKIIAYIGMRNQGTFDLCGGEQMPGDIHQIVDSARDPQIAVLVSSSTIPSAVVALEWGEVGLHESENVHLMYSNFNFAFLSSLISDKLA